MKNTSVDRLNLIGLIWIAVLLIPCIMLTSCVEEKQLDDLIQQTDQEQPVILLPGLPEDVAGYEHWLKINADPIPPVPGGDPHNGNKNVYVNQTPDTIAPDGEQQFPYPDGSIVVKEASRPNKDYIGLIAIMRKVAGSDPDHNDWEFIEYTRNDPDAKFTVLASGRICWGCHEQVENIDYVFTELD